MVKLDMVLPYVIVCVSVYVGGGGELKLMFLNHDRLYKISH